MYKVRPFNGCTQDVEEVMLVLGQRVYHLVGAICEAPMFLPQILDLRSMQDSFRLS
ncbi:MAG: hypothetical protein J4O03_11190 [Chloroflexi bacterium]|nr:hypothetical protein [Chloroflexota bacterium]